MSLPSAFPVGLTVCEVTGQQENCMNTHGNMCHILGFCRELSLQRSLRCRINEHKISFFIECHPFWRYCIYSFHCRCLFIYECFYICFGHFSVWGCGKLLAELFSISWRSSPEYKYLLFTNTLDTFSQLKLEYFWHFSLKNDLNNWSIK